MDMVRDRMEPQSQHGKSRAVAGVGQMELFQQGNVPGQPSREQPPQSARQLDVVFRWNQPAPESLTIGNMRLESYLREQGAEDVFLIRELLLEQDWSGFESGYKAGGRLPYHPAALVGLIVFGIMNGVSSLRGLEQLARYDTRIWWLTGGILPDHSAIGRFITKHGKLLSEDVFESITRQILKRVQSKSASIAIDGTVVRAAASRYKTVKQEAAREAAERAAAELEKDPDNPELKKQAELKSQVAQQAELRSQDRKNKGRANPEASVAASEPQAVVQQTKEQLVAPSYKPSVGVSPERIITGHHVEPSSETAAVIPIIEQHERVHPEGCEEALMDAGYHSGPLLQALCDRQISPLCPAGKSIGDDWEKVTDKLLPKSQFRYDEQADCYWCPQGHPMPYLNRYLGKEGSLGYRRYQAKDCGKCPRKASCCRAAGSRRILRYQGDEYKDAMREVMRHPQAKKRYKRRQAWVEPVFSELKGIQRMTRFHRRGLNQVRVEFGLHCIAHNLRRLVAVLGGSMPIGRLRRALRKLINALTATLYFFAWINAQIRWKYSDPLFEILAPA